MRGKGAAFALLLATTLASTGAGAMSGARSGRCAVVGAEKLPASAGGGAAICSQVEREIAAAAPKARFTVEVRVLSPSRLVASLVVNGRKLPDQNFAVMDRNLSETTIGHFARSLAEHVAEAAKS